MESDRGEGGERTIPNILTLCYLKIIRSINSLADYFSVFTYGILAPYLGIDGSQQRGSHSACMGVFDPFIFNGRNTLMYYLFPTLVFSIVFFCIGFNSIPFKPFIGMADK